MIKPLLFFFLSSLSLSLCGQELALAVKNEDSGAIKKLLKKGDSINEVDEDGKSALAYAILQEDVSLVKKLLKEDAQVDASAIIASAQKNNSKINGMIRKQGLSLNSLDSKGNTPLMHALKTNDDILLQFMLNNDADVNIADPSATTPLLYAILNNKGEDVVQAILEKEANPDFPNKAGQSPLLVALEQENMMLIKLLLASNANVNVKTKNGNTPFWFALDKENLDLAQSLVEQGANPNASRNGETPLLYALKTGKKDLFKRLINFGADVNTDGLDGLNPLMLTMKSGDQELFNFLLNYEKTKINKANRFGYTILDEAFRSGSSQLIRSLIQKGAEFGPAQRKNNLTPLMYAIEFDKTDLIYELINDSEINKENHFGHTALTLAISKGNKNLVENLINRGASVRTSNYMGNCPVGYAVAYNEIEILFLLVQKGGNVNCQNNYGSTPLIEAAYYNLPQVASFLIRAGADRNHRANFGDNAYDVAQRLENKEVLAVLSR